MEKKIYVCYEVNSHELSFELGSGPSDTLATTKFEKALEWLKKHHESAEADGYYTVDSEVNLGELTSIENSIHETYYDDGDESEERYFDIKCDIFEE